MLDSIRTSIVLAVVIIATICTVVAQSGGKNPWDWTDGERIALRVVAQAKPRGGTITRGTTNAKQTAPVLINGKQNPELLMPSQLFGTLLVSVSGAERDSDRRQRLHARHAATIQQLGWSPDRFWNTLEQHAQAYNEMLAAAGRNRSESTSIAICRARVDALHDMRAHYRGFDQFLYQSVAPDLTLASDRRESAERLSWIERGCQ